MVNLVLRVHKEAVKPTTDVTPVSTATLTMTWAEGDQALAGWRAVGVADLAVMMQTVPASVFVQIYCHNWPKTADLPVVSVDC